MVLTATLTTGCTDENEDVAYNLWGTWEGNMYMQSQYNGRVYQSSYSVLAFDKNPYQYASGTGYWIDYYSNAPWDYYSSRIQWRVTGNQEIQIYSENEGRTYYIYNYSMGSYRFTGWIDDGQNDPVYFELRKTSEPDWGDKPRCSRNRICFRIEKRICNSVGNMQRTEIRRQFPVGTHI